MENKHCKNCGYLWNQHPEGAVDRETYTVVRIMIEPEEPTDCKCLVYYPTDNLGYLEWESKQRE